MLSRPYYESGKVFYYIEKIVFFLTLPNLFPFIFYVIKHKIKFG